MIADLPVLLSLLGNLNLILTLNPQVLKAHFELRLRCDLSLNQQNLLLGLQSPLPLHWWLVYCLPRCPLPLAPCLRLQLLQQPALLLLEDCLQA